MISKDGLEFLRERLLPLAWVITPNIAEAAMLTGLEVNSLEQMNDAALRLQRMGAAAVIITGGHLDAPLDLVVQKERTAVVLEGKKISSPSTHGTGCAFSTSLACNLAKGKSLIQSARAAKRYVETALLKPISMGTGIGPLV
jgi:hydroxymethylpyrimidine/phosphomethylpyrimidine kinase